MANPILYSFDISPPVLAVRSTAAAIGLELDDRVVDLTQREHLQPWFLKLNSMHTVPTLDDNGSVIFDSHAIAAYLVDKYAPGSTFYPADLVVRAKIQQMFYFDSGTLFCALKKAQFPVFTRGASSVKPEVIDEIFKAFDELEKLLNVDGYLVGDRVTLADLSCVTSVLSAQAILTLDVAKYPKIMGWLQRLDRLACVRDINAESASGWRALIEKNKSAEQI